MVTKKVIALLLLIGSASPFLTAMEGTKIDGEDAYLELYDNLWRRGFQKPQHMLVEIAEKLYVDSHAKKDQTSRYNVANWSDETKNTVKAKVGALLSIIYVITDDEENDLREALSQLKSMGLLSEEEWNNFFKHIASPHPK